MFCEIPVLGRCLFCLPLRIGVLIFGYLNVIFAAFMVGIYSYSIHTRMGMSLVFHGVVADIDDEICLFLFCLDILFSLAWVYGAHRKILLYIRVYYYYAIVTTVLMLLLQIISLSTTAHYMYIFLEVLALFFAGLCVHVYMILLTRSLITKLELSVQHTYENQLHTIINGELKADGNGVYPATVEPNETA